LCHFFFCWVQDVPEFIKVVECSLFFYPGLFNNPYKQMRVILRFSINPVRNSSEAFNPALRGGTRNYSKI
jgi:hypothetical protein